MSDSVVLDTSACFALLENEDGAEIVERFLLDAEAGKINVHASFVTLTEVEYIITQERSEADARLALSKVKAWPVTWQHTNDSLCAAAAKLKASYKISFADSFVAATAQLTGATLVHKDPEFEALKDVIKLFSLPAKSKA